MFGFGEAEEVEKKFGFAAAGTEVNVGDPDRPVGRNLSLHLRSIQTLS